MMRVIENISAFQKNFKKPLVLALGNFDGIHLGHQKLLDYVVSQSIKLRGKQLFLLSVSIRKLFCILSMRQKIYNRLNRS